MSGAFLRAENAPRSKAMRGTFSASQRGAAAPGLLRCAFAELRVRLREAGPRGRSFRREAGNGRRSCSPCGSSRRCGRRRREMDLAVLRRLRRTDPDRIMQPRLRGVAELRLPPAGEGAVPPLSRDLPRLRRAERLPETDEIRSRKGRADQHDPPLRLAPVVERSRRARSASRARRRRPPAVSGTRLSLQQRLGGGGTPGGAARTSTAAWRAARSAQGAGRTAAISMRRTGGRSVFLRFSEFA